MTDFNHRLHIDGARRRLWEALRARRGLGCWLSVLLALPAAASDAPATPPPELELTVVLQKNALRPDDEVPVQIWLANTTAIPISTLELHVHAPGFLRVVDGSCELSKEHRPEEAGAARSPATVRSSFPRDGLGAYGARHESLLLCADRQVVEGSFRLLFVAELAWEASDDLAAGVALETVEQEIEVSLLGSDSFGGFSLRLAAVVLPGLLLWLALRLWGFPLVARLASVETAALSLLASALMNTLATTFWPQRFPGGMSLTRLALLSGAGLGLGALVGLGWKLGEKAYVGWRAGHPRPAPPPFRPEENRTFRHLLRQLERQEGLDLATQNFEVVTTDGETYLGSMGGWTHDGSAVLLYGWFEVAASDPQVKKDLRQHRDNGSFAAMLGLARRRKLAVSCSNDIQRRDKDGQEKYYDRAHTRWPESRVARAELTGAGLPKPPVDA